MTLTIPKLDLSKATKFSNLADPYAYLREEMLQKTLHAELSQTVIEASQVLSVCSSEWDGQGHGASKEANENGSRTLKSLRSFENHEVMAIQCADEIELKTDDTLMDSITTNGSASIAQVTANVSG